MGTLVQVENIIELRVGIPNVRLNLQLYITQANCAHQKHPTFISNPTRHIDRQPGTELDKPKGVVRDSGAQGHTYSKIAHLTGTTYSTARQWCDNEHPVENLAEINSEQEMRDLEVQEIQRQETTGMQGEGMINGRPSRQEIAGASTPVTSTSTDAVLSSSSNNRRSNNVQSTPESPYNAEPWPATPNPGNIPFPLGIECEKLKLVKQLRAKNHTVAEISRISGATMESTSRSCRQYDDGRRGVGGSEPEKTDEEGQKHWILHLRREGKSFHEIATLTGVPTIVLSKIVCGDTVGRMNAGGYGFGEGAGEPGFCYTPTLSTQSPPSNGKLILPSTSNHTKSSPNTPTTITTTITKQPAAGQTPVQESQAAGPKHPLPLLYPCTLTPDSTQES